ncbi:hypothetical protein [Gilvibacter sp.]|uniref:hypothetical protein n=1 Tax=Gilvibacter sp. TaxID=2729997 RepID=UPI0025BE62C0|nr:hypothetical protein [Gilvibacter sp.]NQX76100.1 hypothetical protein [Gilvibacter sp.]
MNLKKSFLLAVSLALIFLAAWEIYLRSTMKSVMVIDDNQDLWAVQRHRVQDLTQDDVILTGSSRVLFNVQLDVWEQKIGRRPLQLANVGSSPLPVFHDLVNNTDFNGTILVGVSPGLFFSTTFPKAMPWEWPQSRVDHYHKRTYAQRSNHWLSMPLQKSFYFISAEEESGDDSVDLKAIVDRQTWGTRAIDSFPTTGNFGDIEADRNLRMTQLCATDTANARTIKNFWAAIMKGDATRPPDINGTTNFFLKDLEKFTARGGKVILLRSPSTGPVRLQENERLPRTIAWDSLVIKTKAPGYHFEDYPALSGFDCPEWSHLSGPDADIFTAALVDQMIADGVLQTNK